MNEPTFSLSGVGPDKPPQGKTVAWNGHVLNVEMDSRRAGTHTYIVTLIRPGAWPTDEELLSLCDGSLPPVSNYFGGRVKSMADGRKFVCVYVD